MSAAPNGSEHGAGSVADERWELVHRIAASGRLVKAPQLREILIYIVRRALTEQAAAITEQEIGCKVLGRRPDFSPNEDNIVRVQVRHLRRKLEEYFSAEGAGEPILLTIPKGGYLPHFESRPPAAAPAATTAAAPPPRRASLLYWAVAIAVMLGSLALWSERGTLRRWWGAGEAAAGRGDPLWSRMFAPGRETTIVVSDSCLVLVQDILDVDVPLSDYLSSAYPEKLIEAVPDRSLQKALRLLAARQYTSLGDVTSASRFMELSRRYTAQGNIRYSRFVSAREFKTGNFILVGSRRGIPWEQLFESRLNFSLEEDHATAKYFFRNKSPLPGEQPSYRLEPGRDAATYADIALLPNLTGTGEVLILAGIDMAATESAAELVASPDFGEVLTRMLRSRPGQRPASYIEILVQAKAVAGTAEGTRIVGYRLLPGPKSRP